MKIRKLRVKYIKFRWRILGFIPHHSVIKTIVKQKSMKIWLWFWFKIFSKVLFLTHKKINIFGSDVFVKNKNVKTIVEELDQIIVLASLLNYKIKQTGDWGRGKNWSGYHAAISLELDYKLYILQFFVTYRTRILKGSNARFFEDTSTRRYDRAVDYLSKELGLFEPVFIFKNKL